MRGFVQRKLHILKTTGLQEKTTLRNHCTMEVVLKKGDKTVGLMTIKQFAESQNVTYEAVRKQIVSYGEDLKDHIIRNGRTQYLDEWAVEFLTKRRKENPVILLSQEKDETIEFLKSQVETLRVQLMTAQNELLKEKDRIIELQDEVKKNLEAHVRYTALLEDNKAKEEKLKEAESQITEIKRESDGLSHEIETIREETDKLRKKSEDDQRMIERLQKERDEAQTEAQSFTRSFLGFYRKNKQSQ